MVYVYLQGSRKSTRTPALTKVLCQCVLVRGHGAILLEDTCFREGTDRNLILTARTPAVLFQCVLCVEEGGVCTETKIAAIP